MTFEIQEVGPLKEVRAGRIIAEAEYIKDKLDVGALDILGKAQAGIASAAELNALSNAASALIPFERRFRQPTARELILLHLSIASEQGSVSSAEIEDCLEIAGQNLILEPTHWLWPTRSSTESRFRLVMQRSPPARRMRPCEPMDSRWI